MSWFNPFRKPKIEVDKKLLENQVSFTNKMSSLMEKYVKTIDNFQKVVVEQDKQIKFLKKFYDSLKNRSSGTKKPDFLNDNDSYHPSVKIDTLAGDKNIILDTTGIYTINPEVLKIVNNNGWRDLYVKDKKMCAQRIWEYVVNNISYEFDKGEDWRFSPVTLKYGKGDCEDTTILFVDLAREAGFRADEVFNACGQVVTSKGKFGHSFPILNYGEGWYIYETTLTRIRRPPMKFKGSNYEAVWGLSNFWYSGKLKNNEKQI